MLNLHTVKNIMLQIRFVVSLRLFIEFGAAVGAHLLNL